MARLVREGIGIHWEEHGAGPAVLLSHGYSATSAMWQPQVAELAARHRVLVWDMRGHGRSDSPGEPALYSEAHTVADMAALLDRAGESRAVVGGLSLGGYMSLAFYLRHPERVRALVLMDTGPGYKSESARAGWNENAEATARRFADKGLAALPKRAEVTVSHHQSAQGLVLAARGMLKQTDDRVIRSLPDVAVPTLLLVGAEDRPFLAAMEYMAQKIPRAQHCVIPGAGHAANLHQPELVTRAVERFLAELPGA